MKKEPLKIKKWNVYLTDLNPRHKAEPGKVRPAVVVQTDLLNNTHPTTIICPLTTNIQGESELLRVHLKKSEAGSKEQSDVIVDQLRAIDNSRFIRHMGVLHKPSIDKLKERINLILD